MPKKTPNVNYSFILDHLDEENAWGMFEYLLHERPLDRGCCQVIERGASPCKCKCLTRIAQVICKDVIREAEGDDCLIVDQVSKLAKWEQWKGTLIFFARLLRVVADHPENMSTFVQLLHHFNHSIQRNNSHNKVKALVVPTPIGPLMMDWNGIFELGGQNHKNQYQKFFKKFITSKEAASRTCLKAYVLGVVYNCQTNSNTFLDCVQVAIAKKVPLGKLQRLWIIQHRKTRGYYLTDPSNYHYYGKAMDSEVVVNGDEGNEEKLKQVFQDENTNVPVCLSFIKEMDTFLVVAHRDVPRTIHQPNCHACCGEVVSSVLFTTDGQDSTPGEFPVKIAGNIGVLQASFGPSPLLLRKLQERVQWDGSQHNGRVCPVNLEMDGFDNLFRALGEPVSFDFFSFRDVIFRGCLSLLPRRLPGSRFVIKFAAEGNICPVPSLQRNFQWAPEYPYRADKNLLLALESKGIFPFFGVMPLQKEGKFVMTYPYLGTEIFHQGQLVYVPFGMTLLCPMQVFWDDSTRTSLAGNPSVIFRIFIIPEVLDPSIVGEVLPEAFPSMRDHLYCLSPRLQALGKFLGF
jgi:hypothetical protein